MDELIGADRITLTYINMATLLFQIDTKGTVSYLATEQVSFIRHQVTNTHVVKDTYIIQRTNDDGHM